MAKIYFFVLLCFIMTSALFFQGCKSGENGTENSINSEQGNENSTDEQSPETDTPSEDGSDEKIEVPGYKDYNRGTIDFKNIEYTRPNFKKTISDFEAVTEVISKNEITFDEQIALIEDLEEPYIEILTAYSYTNIMNSKDSSAKQWADEYAFVSGEYPSFSKAVEKMFVAAATSPHAARFEEEYFGEGLISEYSDGGKYTDDLVSLMESESELEAEYSALSTSNVVISYFDLTDTFDNIMHFFEIEHGKDSAAYAIALANCTRLYEEELKRVSCDMLVELMRIRRRISDELNYSSYAVLAYEEIYHDYSEQDMLSFISDIKNYIIPVYITVENFVFSDFFAKYEPSSSTDDKDKIINELYGIINDLDADMGDIYSYMIQHGLYDTDYSSPNRFEGSFATYLDKYNAPYLFATLDGSINDYLTVSHEFGHFADNFINYGSSTSLDLSEISSMGFEWLVIDSLDEKISKKDNKYLHYKKYEQALETFIYQGFYALFEHYAYQIDESNINSYSLNAAVDRAARALGLNEDVLDLEHVVIPHVMLYPFYVQSYCIAEACALEIHFKESENEGAGFEIYKQLIDRKEGNLTFEEHLRNANVTNPFDEGYLRYVADNVYFKIMGSHIFPNVSEGNNNAA